jgi:hypothetical protein
VPTRKQRRRQAKDRRHEYEYVYVDDEGQEVEVDEPEAAKPAKTVTQAKAAKPGAQPAKGRRVPQPPSWNRAVRRSIPWGAVMLVLMLFLLRGQPLAGRIFFAMLYALLFIPFTYWVEKLTWNRYQRQQGQAPPPRGGTKKKP